MIVAFEHVKHAQSATGNLVRAVEKHDYIHTELIFNHQNWQCFSAHLNQGVAFRTYEDIIRHPALWQCYLVEPPHGCDPSDHRAYAAAEKLVGTRFNLPAMLGIVTQRDHTHADRRFCSQLAYEILTQHTGLALPPVPSHEVTPRILHAMFADQYPEVYL